LQQEVVRVKIRRNHKGGVHAETFCRSTKVDNSTNRTQKLEGFHRFVKKMEIELESRIGSGFPLSDRRLIPNCVLLAELEERRGMRSGAETKGRRVV